MKNETENNKKLQEFFKEEYHSMKSYSTYIDLCFLLYELYCEINNQARIKSQSIILKSQLITYLWFDKKPNYVKQKYPYVILSKRVRHQSF